LVQTYYLDTNSKVVRCSQWHEDAGK